MYKFNVIKSLALLFLLSAATTGLHAQIKYGFKTGLNFARFSGPSEIDASGNALETWKNATGFHIGMTFSHPFTDNFGVRGEFLYSKRGAKYTFEGPSYRIFQSANGSVLTLGTSRYLINISNSYIDIPVMFYGKFHGLEISAGAYAGVLVASSGEGSLRYSGKTTGLIKTDVYEKSTNNKELSFNLNYNYRKDDPGEGTSSSNTETPLYVQVGSVTSETPKTLGAYYDYPAGSSRLFNSLDFGLVGGISYYVSHALYLGVRIQYGLADITNNKGDLSKGSVGSNGELIYRNDKDQNFMIQGSVGFSF